MIPKRLNLLLSIYLWVACAAIIFAIGWFVPAKILFGWLGLGLVCYILLLIFVPSIALGAPRALGEPTMPREKNRPKVPRDIVSESVLGLLPAIVIAPFILIVCSVVSIVCRFRRKKAPDPIQTSRDNARDVT